MSEGLSPFPAEPSAPSSEATGEMRTALASASPDTIGLLQRALALLDAQQERIRTLESLTVTDPLTGLLNRRGFDEALTRTLALSHRHGEEGVLAYIDLDGFKQVNDTFGHDAGDAVLRHVAALLTRTVRTTDYIARLGGDEFAVIFTSTAPEACRPILQKLRRALQGSIARIDDRLVTVRASIGAEPFGQDSDLRSLISAADKAMYRAKHRRIQRAA